MTVDLPLARAVASRVSVLAETGSTNSDLRRLAGDVAGWPHLSVLLTENQTAGRGRLDRTWVAPPGAALAISVLLRRLPAGSARGWIPLAAGLAMADAVAAQLPGREVGVKWPNDVLVDGSKICGVLAEATVDAVIVGAGVNTAMTAEQLPVPTATSFAVLGEVADVDALLAHYLRRLDSALGELCAAGDAASSGLHAAVSERCVTIGRQVSVSLPDGRMLTGTATGLDRDGRLLVATGAETSAVAAGDVVHVRPARG
jgi:BirA family biotin operon repressor/biotin-[acetyl-CoA-carboxylase] ligase